MADDADGILKPGHIKVHTKQTGCMKQNVTEPQLTDDKLAETAAVAEVGEGIFRGSSVITDEDKDDNIVSSEPSHSRQPWWISELLSVLTGVGSLQM